MANRPSRNEISRERQQKRHKDNEFARRPLPPSATTGALSGVMTLEIDIYIRVAR
jgi:hypothetical protein